MDSLIATIPHSGEMVPPETPWLGRLEEPVLMRDVDRFVDQLYLPVIHQLKLPHVIASCHRYVIDLNRKPEEFDADSVKEAPFPAGTHPKGLHWSVTTFGEKLIPEPMEMSLHNLLVDAYYSPFHAQVQKLSESLAPQEIFHLDLHSMPSQGTALHNDPGAKRADIVVSDFHGKSSRKDFVDLIIDSYRAAGFEVAYNWPYFGGGITQTYGRPDKKHHTVQVELNRALYMNEETKQRSEGFLTTEKALTAAIQMIFQNGKHLLK